MIYSCFLQYLQDTTARKVVFLGKVFHHTGSNNAVPDSFKASFNAVSITVQDCMRVSVKDSGFV